MSLFLNKFTAYSLPTLNFIIFEGYDLFKFLKYLYIGNSLLFTLEKLNDVFFLILKLLLLD